MNVKKIVFPDDLKSLEKEINNMKSKIEIAAKEIAKQLSEYGLESMQEIYDNFDLKSNEPSTFYIEGTDKEKRLFMSGPQAIYDEFGTGTEGETRPHPIKKAFNLNDYNTGKTIRPAGEKISKETTIPIGELYWTYKDVNGNIVYTQGTPAQREVYDSINKTYEKSPEVIKKVMKEVVFND